MLCPFSLRGEKKELISKLLLLGIIGGGFTHLLYPSIRAYHGPGKFISECLQSLCVDVLGFLFSF